MKFVCLFEVDVEEYQEERKEHEYWTMLGVNNDILAMILKRLSRTKSKYPTFLINITI